MPAATTIPERRRSTRIRTFIGAKIIFNQRQSTLDCMVRNQSDDGALLVFPGSIALPELFELYSPLKRESRMARSRWRDGERIGVSFAAETKQDDAPIQLDLVRRLRQLEQENAALKARIAALTEGA
ncbi:PilZ domain-containing protein [Bosea sp. NPDC003192]|uniref:PilZ domain-containing protein n=1 Tax=Bosea sp. NPDC003192 TaxID=3390551 RepID=UPI003D095943